VYNQLSKLKENKGNYDGMIVNGDELEEYDEWFDGGITKYEPSLKGKMAQFYYITMKEDGHEE